jgi:putative SOS response-associated peptidase YedK
MCYFSQQTKEAAALKRAFNAKMQDEARYKPGIFNAFLFPHTPVIKHNIADEIRWLQWGLIPNWANDNSIRKYTLNARIETLAQRPAYKSAMHQRCLILVDGFYEWQWLDEKGKYKQRYFIRPTESEIFAFAGLWSSWIDKNTGELVETYTILTQPANELMSHIHNSKKRMPVIILPEESNRWLSGQIPFAPKPINLVAIPQS